MESALKHIVDIADTVCQRTSRFRLDLSVPASYSQILPLDLPIPREDALTEELTALGAPRYVSSQLSIAFSRRARELAEKHCQPIYEKTCKQLGRVPLPSKISQTSAFHDAFRHLYRQKLSEWTETIREAVKARTHSQESVIVDLPPVPNDKRNSHRENSTSKFNMEFTPKLEAYFKKNQHPSRADKEFLASKSGMTYRQIHVWFQNRRTRLKKLGTGGPRGSSLGEIMSTSQALLNKKTTGTHNKCGHLPTSSPKYQTFRCRAPSYAFPTQYPPSVPKDGDPFPCRFGDFSAFSEPCWPRKPALARRDFQTVVDLDSLVSALHKLQIVDGAQRLTRANSRTVGKEHGFSRSDPDVASPFSVYPLRAPVMSLTRNGATDLVRHPNEFSIRTGSSQKVDSAIETSRRERRSARKRTQRPVASSCCQVFTNQNSMPSRDAPSRPSSAADLYPSKEPHSPKKALRKPPLPVQPYPSLRAHKKRSTSLLERRVQNLSESLISYHSPESSSDSIPSLSYSRGSSSCSDCSQSPTMSLATLSDDSHLPTIDPFEYNDSYSFSQLQAGALDESIDSTFALGNCDFDVSKRSLNLAFALDFPTHPSYSESFGSISQVLLQSSPDFAPPTLTFDSPSCTA